MNTPLHIAVAGLGTVGAGTLKLLQTHGEMLRQRCGRQIVVAAVSARDKGRDRGVDLGGIEWYDDAAAMAAGSGVEVVVEPIGGADGVAKAVCEAAIASGKHVVTANRALLAPQGPARASAGAAERGSLGA